MFVGRRPPNRDARTSESSAGRACGWRAARGGAAAADDTPTPHPPPYDGSQGASRRHTVTVPTQHHHRSPNTMCSMDAASPRASPRKPAAVSPFWPLGGASCTQILSATISYHAMVAPTRLLPAEARARRSYRDCHEHVLLTDEASPPHIHCLRPASILPRGIFTAGASCRHSPVGGAPQGGGSGAHELARRWVTLVHLSEPTEGPNICCAPALWRATSCCMSEPDQSALSLPAFAPRPVRSYGLVRVVRLSLCQPSLPSPSEPAG